MVVSLTCCSCCLYSSLWLFFMCLSLALALQNVMKHWKHCRFSCWSAKWRIIKKVNQLSFLDWCPVCTKTFHITFFWIISRRTYRAAQTGEEVHLNWRVYVVLLAFLQELPEVDQVMPVPSRYPQCLKYPSPSR